MNPIMIKTTKKQLSLLIQNMIQWSFIQNLPMKTIRKPLISTALLFPIAMIVVNYVFSLSNYPVSFMESQLSFSGIAIKSHYAVMSQYEINIYKLAQLVDYVYLIIYGLFIFSLCIYIGRKLNKHKFIYNSSNMMASAGILAATCDAIENGFILLMASHPKTFLNIYAIVHSVFASIKFILLGLIIIWIIISLLIFIIEQRRNK